MGHHRETEFRPAKAAVITVSDTRTLDNDTSGQLIQEKLAEAGHKVTDRLLLKDDMEVIRAEVEKLLGEKTCRYIIITGGTGLTERDVTPEAVTPLYTKHIPGFGELFRMLSYEEIGTAAVQSRADAGLCGHAVVMILPGSTKACRLGMERIIIPQMDNRGGCTFRGVVPDDH
ncbi:MAG: molybdopterin-binding protein [Acidobacteriota bacterium]|nr:molybdopterin-binding protein [Acidobacteriota bacterium]